MKKFNLFFCALLSASFLFSQTISDFENLTLAADTFWDGSDLSGGFASGNAYFVNDYNTSFFSWSGFTYSNKKDSTTAGYGNQYSAITASGFYGSSNYTVANEYGNAKILLAGNSHGKVVEGFYVTNATYAYLSMRDGDMFAKKFGGSTGTDPDWFKLTAKGWSNGTVTVNSVEFYLADFRSADSAQDYIVREWQWVDLRPLGNVDSIFFQLQSSDTGTFGMNTPAYFALDNFTASNIVNAPPVANDDYVITNYLNDTLINVLANDFDTTFATLTIELIGSPLIPGASDTVINNQIWYTPAIGLVATDTLVYKVCDATNSCDTARVIINVTGITGFDDLVEAEINVFPNPVSGDFVRLKLPENFIGSELLVSDVTGKVITCQYILTPNSRLSTVNFLPGIYFLRIISGSKIVEGRLVKQ